MKLATCIVIFDGDNILATHRRDNPNDWGLPGGKVDANESPENAIIRELLEETGYLIKNVQFITTDIDGSYLVYCYSGVKEDLIYTNENNEQLGAWVPKNKVLEGCFSDFNTRLFKHIGK